jgi:hypothetical protein
LAIEEEGSGRPTEVTIPEKDAIHSVILDDQNQERVSQVTSRLVLRLK